MTSTVGSEPSSVRAVSAVSIGRHVVGGDERCEPRQPELPERSQRTWGLQGVTLPAQHARPSASRTAAAMVEDLPVPLSPATAKPAPCPLRTAAGLTKGVELALALQQAHAVSVVLSHQGGHARDARD